MAKYRKGQRVKIISASIGWGSVVKGAVGIIKHIDNKDAMVCIPGVHDSWHCKIHDFELCDHIITQDSSAMKFICFLMRQKELYVELQKEKIDSDYWTNECQEKLERKTIRELKSIKPVDAATFTNVMNQIEGIKFDEKNYVFSITTKNCVVPYRHQNVNLLVKVGNFEVTYDLKNNRVRIRQRNAEKYIGGHAHPHVSGERPCWGGYLIPIQKGLKNYDINFLIVTTLDFLNSCSNPGWYRPVMSWLTESEREGYGLQHLCPECGNTDEDCDCGHCSDCGNRDCTCNYCEHCERIGDDCECTICPDTSERLDNNNFPDNSCAKCLHLCRNIDHNQWECSYHGNGTAEHTAPFEEVNFSILNSDRYHTWVNGTRVEHSNVQKSQQRNKAQRITEMTYPHIQEDTRIRIRPGNISNPTIEVSPTSLDPDDQRNTQQDRPTTHRPEDADPLPF